MAVALSEILIFALPVVVVFLLIWRWRKKRRQAIESVVLSLIRSRHGATIDDIIIGAHISAEEASAIIRKFMAKGIIKLEERDEKTIYKIS